MLLIIQKFVSAFFKSANQKPLYGINKLFDFFTRTAKSDIVIFYVKSPKQKEHKHVKIMYEMVKTFVKQNMTPYR